MAPRPSYKRLVDQRVDEAEPADLVGRLVEQRRRDRRLEPIEQLAFVCLHQPTEQCELERAADDRREREQLVGLAAEPLDAASDDVAHTLRQPERGGSVDAPPFRRLVVEQPSRLHEAAQNLADEERVAVGLARDLLREDQPVLVELVPGGRGHHFRHFRCSEALERDPLDALRPGAGPGARR